MSKNRFWYGYLEAGSKSTAVVMDTKMNTGDPDTMYLYNHARQAILEFKRAIVTPKLRELTDDEADLIKELKTAFTKAASNFTPRQDRIAGIPETGGGKAAAAPREVVEEGADEVVVAATEDFDDDADGPAEEADWEDDED